MEDKETVNLGVFFALFRDLDLTSMSDCKFTPPIF